MPRFRAEGGRRRQHPGHDPAHGGDIGGNTWSKYEQREDGEVITIVDGVYSYDGSGEQIVTYPDDNLTCTFTFEANGANCEYECDKGQSGDC